MKIIFYSKPGDEYVEKIVNSTNRSGSIRICDCKRIEDFKEAVRVNTEPKPIIIYCFSETFSLEHLFEIKKYIADAVLLLIMPNDDQYRKVHLERLLYPRYIFNRDDDPYILSAMLDKLTARVDVTY